jgi:asparagine synthase (glutamine-hydrolysing)
MCRIAGILSTAYPIDEVKYMVQSMCTTLQHGGPDDEGIYTDIDNHLCFGHRRLSIIDTTSAGHQPMLYQQNRYAITYNGELYNYLLLKADLKAIGFQFKTNSDTEVLLAAYAAWGTKAFDRLEGMFAFAIYDKQYGTVVLVRDVAGIKPLYYAVTKEGLAFASEVRALRLIPHLQQENNNWPVYLMAYGHLPEPITTLKEVVPLEKGTYLLYDLKSGSSKTTSFFRYSFLEKISDRAQAVSLIQTALEKAVTQHLISDAPIGVFLSGGLDSSIIALLANKHQSKLKTVSLYFEDAAYSEKKYQDALTDKLSCNHQQFLLKENDFHSNLPSIINAMDLPCCDGINTWFISKYAKDSGLKAVLSGVGGDELYGGYPSFKRINTALSLAHIPAALLRTGRFTNSKKLKRLEYLSINGAIGKYLFLRGQFIPSEIAKFLGGTENEIWKILSTQPQLENINYLTPQNQASWMEINLYMQNQLLRDADVMSMAHGLEIRLPFLDKSFMQLTLKIESATKYSGKLGKQLLIDAFKNELPPIVWNRPKMGFTFPFKKWLSNNQYNNSTSGTDSSAYHTKLKNNELHWSQFFTLYLLSNYGKA